MGIWFTPEGKSKCFPFAEIETHSGVGVALGLDDARTPRVNKDERKKLNINLILTAPFTFEPILCYYSLYHVFDASKSASPIDYNLRSFLVILLVEVKFTIHFCSPTFQHTVMLAIAVSAFIDPGRPFMRR